MKKTKIFNLLLAVHIFTICSIVLFLVYDFLAIKDITLIDNSGNYVIITVDNKDTSNLMEEMKKNEDEIKKILEHNAIHSKVATVFYPDLPSFVYYKNSERRKPYLLKVANDIFFKNLNIEYPKFNELYRMKGKYSGELEIRLNTSDSSKNFKDVDYQLYTVVSKAVINKDDLPNFKEAFQYVDFGEYITMETYSSIVQDVYGKNIENYQLGKYSSYQIFIKSENGDISNKIVEVLPEKFYATTDIEKDNGSNILEKWRERLKIGLFAIVILVVLVIILLKKKKRNKNIDA